MKVKTVFSPKEIEGRKVFNNSDLATFKSMVTALRNGEEIARFEWGDSLHPIVRNGQYVKIRSKAQGEVKVGDCVFCYLPGIGFMVHMVQRINESEMNGRMLLIGDSMDGVYGWTNEENTFGIAEPIPYFEDQTQYSFKKDEE